MDHPCQDLYHPTELSSGLYVEADENNIVACEIEMSDESATWNDLLGSLGLMV